MLRIFFHGVLALMLIAVSVPALSQQAEPETTPDESVKKAAEEGGYSKFVGAIVMECAVRLFLLGDNFRKAPEAITSVLGDIPMIGAETYGEIRMTPGEFSGFHNTTTVVLLLVE